MSITLVLALVSTVLASEFFINQQTAKSVITFTAFNEQPLPNGSVFTEYGVTVQYPSIAIQVTNLSMNSFNAGEAQWLWNTRSPAASAIILTWLTSPYVKTVSYSTMLNAFNNNFTHTTIVGKGNLTIDGHSWPYETLHYYEYGTVPMYETTAVAIYASENRQYTLTLDDAANSTLAQLEYWASTFHG